MNMTKRFSNIGMLCIVFLIGLVSCNEKADVNKLFDEADERVVLDFKYILTNEGTFSGATDTPLYHLVYDKIAQSFHVFSSRLAYVSFDETFPARINNFQCTESRICFQNDEIRIIIENAGNSYIAHFYEIVGSGTTRVWEKYMTLFNSDSTPDGLNKKTVKTEEVKDRAEENATEAIAEDDYEYSVDEIETKAQTFLSRYKNESNHNAILGFPIEGEVLRLFPVSISESTKDNVAFEISFSKYDFDNKKEETGITESLPMSGLYVVYQGVLYDCSDLEIDSNGTARYLCNLHEIWTDI